MSEDPSRMNQNMRLFRPLITDFNALIFGLMLCVWPMMAQGQLKLLINQGQNQGQFSIDGDVTYDTTASLLSMDVLLSNQPADAQNPLICFDFSDSDPAVKLQLKSQSSTGSGGSRLLVDELGLTSAIQYQLAAKTIAITPSSDVACFFKAYDASNQILSDDFGLYGLVADGVIFHDGFSAVPNVSTDPELDVIFTSLTSPDSNGAVSYAIVATNNGPFEVSSLALQQTIPLGLDVTVNSCLVNGQASVPVCETAEQDTLRYVDFALASGASLELQVTANRNANWPSGFNMLPIFVAFAAAPTSTNIAFDVAETIINPDPPDGPP